MIQKEIPQATIREIAELIDCGMECFLNPDTMEVENVPNEYDGRFGYSVDRDEWQDVYDKVDSWERFIRISPPESHESFRIMERFVSECVFDRRLSAALQRAISGRKPFAHFNAIVHNSSCREDWFAFKQRCLEEFVKEQLPYNADEEK